MSFAEKEAEMTEWTRARIASRTAVIKAKLVALLQAIGCDQVDGVASRLSREAASFLAKMGCDETVDVGIISPIGTPSAPGGLMTTIVYVNISDAYKVEWRKSWMPTVP